MEKLRVIHNGTGTTGVHALRGIINHPDLELVALYVSTAGKIGKDAGEICEMAPTGFLATSDLQSLVNLGADCLSYCKVGVGREEEAIEQMLPFLEHGTNVTTISLPPYTYLQDLPPDVRHRIEEACRHGSCSFPSISLDPGFCEDVLPMTLFSVVDRVDSVSITGIGVYTNYPNEWFLRGQMGFDMPLDYPSPNSQGNFHVKRFGGLVRQIAAAIGVTLDEVRHVFERKVTDRDCSIGTIAAETVASIRFEVQVIVDSILRIVQGHITRIISESAPEWPPIIADVDGAYRIEIKGIPPVRMDLDFGSNGAAIATAMRLVNALPKPCAAKP